MFKTLMNFARRPNRQVSDALYDRIVASARQPRFYSDWGVDDTPLGRFEMLSLHMVLFLERARGGDQAMRDLAQDVTDEFFKDVEHSLRELGIGDIGVPKRMKKLAKMFYGRAEAYRSALVAGDEPALAEALARNVRPGGEPWDGSAPLAGYLFGALTSLREQADADILAGRIAFPQGGGA
jgi:cytochrome b pre-mRNA-processing protein 3